MNHKISILSYSVENVEIKNPDEEEGVKYTTIFYSIDGNKIPWPEDDYNPIYAYDVLDEEAEKQNLVILFHCFCGIWDCSAIVAHVEELPEGIVKWTVTEHRGKYRTPKEYFFKKEEYEKTMAEIRAWMF